MNPLLKMTHATSESKSKLMEQTLCILKPSCMERGLAGQIIDRIIRKGIIIAGMKMMQLDEAILREHYAHLVDKPFFPEVVKSMTACPVVVMCLRGVDVVEVFRGMTGVTNGRQAAPGTIRGDYCMSNQANIVHASDTPENAVIEVKRFFADNELFAYTPILAKAIYGNGEI